jgi:hypothetical protein
MRRQHQSSTPQTCHTAICESPRCHNQVDSRAITVQDHWSVSRISDVTDLQCSARTHWHTGIAGGHLCTRIMVLARRWQYIRLVSTLLSTVEARHQCSRADRPPAMPIRNPYTNYKPAAELADFLPDTLTHLTLCLIPGEARKVKAYWIDVLEGILWTRARLPNLQSITFMETRNFNVGGKPVTCRCPLYASMQCSI